MPLSEHEERVLREIERRYYANDPQSAKRIATTTIYRHLGRNCRRAALAFLAGLVVLLGSLAFFWLIGIVGFAVMLGSAVVFVQNLRKMGRHGWQQFTQSWRTGQVNDRLGDTRRRLRRRFRKQE